MGDWRLRKEKQEDPLSSSIFFFTSAACIEYREAKFDTVWQIGESKKDDVEEEAGGGRQHRVSTVRQKKA